MNSSQDMFKKQLLLDIWVIFYLQIRIKKHAAIQEASLNRVQSVQRKLEIDFWTFVLAVLLLDAEFQAPFPYYWNGELSI